MFADINIPNQNSENIISTSNLLDSIEVLVLNDWFIVRYLYINSNNLFIIIIL